MPEQDTDLGLVIQQNKIKTTVGLWGQSRSRQAKRPGSGGCGQGVTDLQFFTPYVRVDQTQDLILVHSYQVDFYGNIL